ncbi:MAG: biotin--[acetyl-CoA-carboxylase] ligase [Candidatus Zixiibacteriota bacterium]
MNNIAVNALSDKLLALIRRRSGHAYTLGYILGKLKCTNKELALAVKLLRQSGYKVSRTKKGTIAFTSAPDFLYANEIYHGLTTKFMGRIVHAYKKVQSTNTIASQLASADAPEGTIVIAEEQTRGRGRLGRQWYSTEGFGIYLSMIVYPKIDPMHAPGLSILTAVSLADTISGYDDLDVKIKWPNDCLINGRKVAGILTELSSDLDHVHRAVIGIGININHRRRDFPEDIRKRATSLRAEMKETIHRVEFLQSFLRHFEKDYVAFRKNGLMAFRKRIIDYSLLIGNRITLDYKGTRFTGKAIDIHETGGLILELPEGNRVFTAGEVTVVKA